MLVFCDFQFYKGPNKSVFAIFNSAETSADLFLHFSILQKAQRKCFCVLHACKSFSGNVSAFCTLAETSAEMFLRFAKLQKLQRECFCVLHACRNLSGNVSALQCCKSLIFLILYNTIIFVQERSN